MQEPYITIVRELPETLIQFLATAFGAVLAFLLIYAVTRRFHRSDRWILPTIGFFLLLFVLNSILSGLIRRPGQFALDALAVSANVGVIAVVGVIYALGQLVTRGSYLLAKKRLHSWGSASLRNILRYARSIHQFLGWSILIVTAVHALLYIPWQLAPPLQAGPLPSITFISGGVAWGILAVLVVLGLWTERAVRQKRPVRGRRLIHTTTAAVFLITMIFHITTK